MQYESWRKSAVELKTERKHKTVVVQEKEQLPKRQEECAGVILKELNILKCLVCALSPHSKGSVPMPFLKLHLLNSSNLHSSNVQGISDITQLAQLRASRLKSHEDEKMRMSPAAIIDVIVSVEDQVEREEERRLEIVQEQNIVSRLNLRFIVCKLSN